MFLNLLQLFYVIYLMRPVKFDPELEDAYHTLFQPFKVRSFLNLIDFNTTFEGALLLKKKKKSERQMRKSEVGEERGGKIDIRKL